MLSGIYTITNLVDNKIYVGQTNNFYHRWAVHISHLKHNKHSSTYLQNAWNKYGEESFKFEILEECSIDLLFSLEHYWCNLLQTHNSNYGYNTEKTHPYRKKFYSPMLGKKLSQEHKNKIGNAHKGRKASDETRKKQSLARLGKTAPTKGIKFSKERCDFISKMNTGRKSKQRIKCIINDIEYDGFTEASKILNISLHTIRNRCNNEKFKNYKLKK
jgi:group I intron endonuclease